MHYSARRRIVLRKILWLEALNNKYTKLLNRQKRIKRLTSRGVREENQNSNAQASLTHGQCKKDEKKLKIYGSRKGEAC